MVTPGTTADWIMATTLLGAVIAFTTAGFRWMLRDEERIPIAASRPDLREYGIDGTGGAVRETQGIG